MAEMQFYEKFGRVGILMGGPSTEREVSLKSGKAVQEALSGLGVNAIPIDIQTDSVADNMRLLESYRLDCVFIALHGRFGEDGQIQGILEKMHLPYSGSGVAASRLAMDKIASRRIFEKNGLAVPPYEVVERRDFASGGIKTRLPMPVVVKPTSHGSSIGLSLIDQEDDLAAALKEAFVFDSRVIVEKYISGREMTVGILEEKPLPIVEIIPKHRFFDYDAKYHAGMTDYIVPAKLKEAEGLKIQEAGLAAHKLLGCFGCSRVDIVLNNDNIPVVLEVNTIPGLTATSLLPKAARITGVDFSTLCLRLLETAYEKAGLSRTV